MQPLIPGVIKEDPANAYIVGMADISNTTLQGHLRTLITGLVTDAVWAKLAYFGVIQNLEADTLRCLVRRTSSFSSKVASGYQSLLYTPNSGYSIDTSATPERRGAVSSGYTPDPADIALRDTFGIFQYLGNNGSAAPGDNTPFMGRISTTQCSYKTALTSFYGDPVYARRQQTLTSSGNAAYVLNTETTAYNNPEFQFAGRNDTNTAQIHKNAGNVSVADVRAGTWDWPYSSPNSAIYHLGHNAAGITINYLNNGARLCAWGMTRESISTAQVDALRARLATYLTARGAI